MGSFEREGAETTEALPPPPAIPPNVVPLRAETELITETVKKVAKPKRVPMARPGNGSKGQKIQLLTNHFKVGITNAGGYFYHYSVSLFYEDGRPVDGKGVGRKVIDRVHDTYDTELDGKDLAYDGEKSLFTVGPLPQNKLEFTVVLEDITSNRTSGNGSPGGNGSPNESDRKRFRRSYQSKTFKVEISFAAKIPMQAISNALRGGSIQVFEPPKAVYLSTLVGSYTYLDALGPVVDFLIVNQNARDPSGIDWAKAKRTLKNLRIKASPSNTEYKITGLSENSCKNQTFSLKQKNGRDGDGEVQTIDVTVYEYFVNYRHSVYKCWKTKAANLLPA
ncbi:hypothetical protein HHK36_013180 [Tetracentron sinense]|uniref:PAZ domain-containing protein n=1 Tax=Tetracentron sinense TaxID=13715 RepID=A0A835DF57_TETSI|nr:hypothetical protein HHK36_013180 [Tetracentron sinense]